MKRPSNIYLNYKITNKLLQRVVENEFKKKWRLRLNPHRYILNRTNNKYWNSNIELVDINIETTYTYCELTSLKNQIITNLNIINFCLYKSESREIIDVELKIN